MQRWYRLLSSGAAVSGPIDTFPATEQKLLAPQGIKSLLVVPILTRTQGFWGFIGFDDCRNRREWGAAEASILQTMAATFGEVIERNRALQTAIEQKERLAITLKSIAEGVIVIDESYRVQLLNRAAADMLGIEAEAAIGRRIDEIFILQGKNRRPLHIMPFLHSARQKSQSLFFTRPRMLRTGNATRMINFSISPLSTAEGESGGMVLVFYDISEQKAYQEEALKAARLESIGVLAGGIAHDFNNILGSISGNISLTRARLSGDPELQEIFGEIEAAIHRAHELTLQLLTFAKGGKPIKKWARLEDFVRESARFILRGTSAICDFEFAPNLHPVEIDHGQFHQVIQNLLLNAVEAMPTGGRIVIRAQNYDITEDHFTGLEPGPYVHLQIEDNGIGIPENYRNRIFDPYFTTKQKGSGLGLAICYSIVRRHGGYIGVESEPGVGTTFSIFLPASPRAAAPQQKASSHEVLSGSGRILFMDDEILIQNVASRMLKRLGYEVDIAANGDEAVQLFRTALEEQRPYDLVILDLTVPGGRGGKDTLRVLRQLDPEIKAVVTSGYSNDPILSDFESHGFSGHLEKPFNLSELGRVIRKLLAEK